MFDPGRYLCRHHGNIIYCRHFGLCGMAADEAERRKTLKYERLLDHYCFRPVGFETFGTWGASAKELLSEITRKIQAQTQEMSVQPSSYDNG